MNFPIKYHTYQTSQNIQITTVSSENSAVQNLFGYIVILSVCDCLLYCLLYTVLWESYVAGSDLCKRANAVWIISS